MSLSDSPLGQSTRYPQRYSPQQLHAIARDDSRDERFDVSALPFRGVDYWNVWDMSWLTPDGQPEAATLHIGIDAHSTSLVESKSLKLYLGSFAMSEFSSADQVADTVRADLSSCVGGNVSIDIRSALQSEQCQPEILHGFLLDDLQVSCKDWQVNAELLRADSTKLIEQTVVTHVLRSLCPVTAQPDFGSLQIRYNGPRIEPKSLLRYIVSYRQHNDFHEACVERIFLDLMQRCDCRDLSVYARYQRRGGIDINPFRSNFENPPSNARLWRQ